MKKNIIDGIDVIVFVNWRLSCYEIDGLMIDWYWLLDL